MLLFVLLWQLKILQQKNTQHMAQNPHMAGVLAARKANSELMMGLLSKKKPA